MMTVESGPSRVLAALCAALVLVPAALAAGDIDALRDATDLKISICTIDATESPQAIHLVDESPQIDVTHTCHPHHRLASIDLRRGEYTKFAIV